MSDQLVLQEVDPTAVDQFHVDDENQSSNPLFVAVSTLHAQDKVADWGGLECNARSTIIGVFPTRKHADDACEREQEDFTMTHKDIFHLFGSKCTTFQVIPCILVKDDTLVHDNPLQVMVVISTLHAMDDVSRWGGLECNAQTTVIGVYESETLAKEACHAEQEHFPMSNNHVFHQDFTNCTTFQIAAFTVISDEK